MLKKQHGKKKISFKKFTATTTAFALLLSFVNLMGYAAPTEIDETAPYTGNVMIALNATASGYFTGVGNTDISPPQESSYSIGRDGVAPEGIIGYDDEGNGLLDPADYLPEIDVDSVIPPDYSTEGTPSYSTEDYSVGNTKTLNVQITPSSSTLSPVNFEVIATREHCTVWTPTGDDYSPISTAAAQTLAEEFDTQYDIMVAAYGSPMEDNGFADPDGDGKIALICYDIHNGINSNGTYVAGYFFAGDMLSSSGSSGNNIDALHIDSAAGMGNGNNVARSYSTLVHEFQHLINFVNAGYMAYSRDSGGAVYGTPTFLNEGLSESAEFLIYNDYGRVETFNSSSTNAPVTDWEGTLSSYSMVFLFMQYLRTQYKDPNSEVEAERNGSALFKEIIAIRSNFSRYAYPTETEFFTEVAKIFNTDPTTLLENFFLALYLKQDSGVYGFDGEEWADSIDPKLYTNSVAPDIKPGGAIFYGSHQQYSPTVVNPDSIVRFFSVTANSSVTGNVVSYDPNKALTVTFKSVDGGADIPATVGVANSNGDRVTNTFSAVIPYGRYTITVSKDGHLSAIVENILVSGDNMNINELIELYPGDINANGSINKYDLELMMSASVYNKSAVSESAVTADINGDGIVDFLDVTIVRNSVNFGKTN